MFKRKVFKKKVLDQMGNTQNKIKEVVTATANAPPAISISIELAILICILFTFNVLIKYVKNYVKKQINRVMVKTNINNIA